MSDMEYNKGKLRLFHKEEKEKMSDYILRFFKYKDIEFPEDPMGCIKQEDFIEAFEETFYRKAYIRKGKIYEIIDSEREVGCPSIFDVHVLTNGDIEFTLQYYNGGCSFNEAMDLAFKRLT